METPLVILTSSLLAIALQVGPNPSTIPPTDVHQELRDREPRETGEEPISPESQWLIECLGILQDDPARAHTLAQLKRNETIGAQRVLANHCLGLAATELLLWDDAIEAFGAARDETPEDELRARARFGTMAGNAALAGGYPGRAETILLRAKTDAEQAASATLKAIAASDLARVLVALDRPDEALAELETATTLTPDNAESWLLKATLLRRLERLDEAQAAIERAGELAPSEQQIGLEAGVIAVLSGREDAARQSWQSVIEIEPDSVAAQTAQGYLDQIGPPAAQEPL